MCRAGILLSLAATLALPWAGGQTLSTVAGGGPLAGATYPASKISLSSPKALVEDQAGNLYIAVYRRVLKMDPNGAVTVYAGNGGGGYHGDGGPATAAAIGDFVGLAINAQGDLFIADDGNNVIRKVSAATGVISTVAGTGAPGFSGDGGPALQAQLKSPESVALDAAGDLFIADTGNFCVREVSAASGDIFTAAGVGGVDPNGAGGASGPATSISLPDPRTVALDSGGNLYIGDRAAQIVWRVDAHTGLAAVAAGRVASFGANCASATDAFGDGCPATQARLDQVAGLALDPGGNLWISESAHFTGHLTGLVRRVDAASGVITTAAGGVPLACEPCRPSLVGDGGPATAALLVAPQGLLVDRAGNLLIADQANFRVRTVGSASGLVATLAGNGQYSDTGDGGPATAAQINAYSVAPLPQGGFVFADPSSGTVRAVDAASGAIATVAGSGVQGYSGDGGPATAAALYGSFGVAADAKGNLWVADSDNNVVREVDAASGVISTVAGTGTAGYSGDGGPATQAQLNFPDAIAVDPAGNVYFAEDLNCVVREIRAQDGSIRTVAGSAPCPANGLPSGDGGPATAAKLGGFLALAVDAHDNLFIADLDGDEVREVPAATGVIAPVAGNGSGAFISSGDGGPALSAGFQALTAVAVDPAGNLYVDDAGRIREVNAATATVQTIAGGGSDGAPDYSGPALGAAIGSVFNLTATPRGELLLADFSGPLVRHLLPQPELSALALSFGGQQPGSASVAQTVTVTNNSAAALAMGGITVAGANAADFAQTNTCGASLPPAGQCTVSVVFTPSAAGARTAALHLSDAALTSPQTILLAGTGGMVPQAALSAADLTFAAELVGDAAAAQTITLTNSGNGALAVASVKVSGDYSETDNCAAGVAPGARCAIQVTFKPTATGNRAGSLTIADNAGTGSQTVSLDGTGQDLTLAASPVALTIMAGQTANFSLTLSPSAGFGGSVALGCAVAPAAAGLSCTISPGTLSLSGTAAQNATMTITTVANSRAFPFWLWIGPLAALALVADFRRLRSSPRRSSPRRWILATVLGTAALAAGCGGATATIRRLIPGNYTLTVTATAPNGTRSAQIVLTVL